MVNTADKSGLSQLAEKSIVILGFGTEGQATYGFLRKRWPEKVLAISDRRPLEEFPEDVVDRLKHDPALQLYLGSDYLDSLDPAKCDVIVKTPGIPASMKEIAGAVKAGCYLTSHSQIFLSNYPREKVIAVTGTKGKSTTTALIHHILESAEIPAELAGNIGRPPLARIDEVSRDTIFVHEFSSHQLAELETSAHIAVLLNIVPEHLDYYATFEDYVAAKENITRFQTEDDFLVFNSGHEIPAAIAARSKARLKPFSTHRQPDSVGEIPLPGKYNLENVFAAATTASLCNVPSDVIRDAIRTFKPLPHRLELAGTFRGITFYDDSIATVPEATLGALEALGPRVHTLILGGHERHLDFKHFASNLPENVKTVILFPTTGARIWRAIEQYSNAALPQAFFVSTMDQAVTLAYAHTPQGSICLLSPASPSFGTFKDYRERGNLFKALVKTFSNS